MKMVTQPLTQFPLLEIYNFFFFSDAILTMVNNIAANVLGGKPELEDGAQMEGIQEF